MPTATYGVTLSAGGVSIQKSIIRTADSQLGWEVNLPVATALITNSWVMTDANTAAANMTGGHGLVNATYDCYWSAGLRYGVAGTITDNAIALEGGSGDNFPANATAVTVCKQVAISSAIDGDNVKILGLSLEYASSSSTSKGHVDMQDSGNATIAEIDLNANAPLVYDIEGGTSNVFTGNAVASTKASHNDVSAAGTLKICGVVDSTP